MQSNDVLLEGFGRVPPSVRRVVDGLTVDQLTERLDPQANTIAWLVWHLTRIQDDHVADVAATEQVWTANGWSDRFALTVDDAATGYGFDADDVAAVRAEAELLTGYLDAVHERTTAYVRALEPADLDRVVDEAWDPPVTLGVRLVSVIADDLQHVGQAAFLRGVLARTRWERSG